MRREATDKLEKMLSDVQSSHVVIVEGARQVGKSYLVNSVLEKQPRPYIAFDLEKNAKLRRDINNTEDFTDFQTLMGDRYGLRADHILFFDEAQECPVLGRYVKSFKEDLKEVKVVLTGSSMNRFFEKDVRVPVGRTRSLGVYPFVFSEFVQFVKGDGLADFLRSAPEEVPASRHQLLLELFDDYLRVGGYPEAVMAHRAGADPFEVIDEIMATLEEDFERKEAYRPALFREIVGAVANNIGSPSKLTQFDTTKYHAKRVLSAMQGWHLVLEVQPMATDPKHTRFLPKRYLHDVGVVHRRRSLATPTLSMLGTLNAVLRTPLGGLFENAVLLNLLQAESVHYAAGAWKQRSNSDIEVDFVFDHRAVQQKIPIECKATPTVKRKHYRNLVHYLNATNQRFGVLVSAAPMALFDIEGKTILNLPIYLATKQNLLRYAERLAG